MVGSDLEAIHSPFYNIPIHLWPWDFKRVFNHRRAIENIEREISFHTNVLPPSTRTKRSSKGMEEWRVWVKRTEATMKNRPGEKNPFDEGFIPDFMTVFDYKT